MFDKQRIIDYVNDKHMPDGGYFFAKIEPSGGLDTYHAVRILHMLGAKPEDPQGIKKFFLDLEVSDGIDDMVGLYLTVGTFKELGYSITRFHSYKTILDKVKNEQGGFGTTGEIYIEVASELEETYQAIVVAKDLNISLDLKALKKFILSFQNTDRGFGSHELSLLPTTYYALASLNALELIKEGTAAIEYLREKEKKMSGFYLEDLYWFMTGLHFLKQKVFNPQEVLVFLLDCWRQDNGGFCRSRNMGISTFEDTFYAVTILKILEETGIRVWN